MSEPIQPILVVMVWRGGARFDRCLLSVGESLHRFQRVVLSITSTADSADMRRAREFAADHPTVEVLCTGRELPTMAHQAFWVDHLESTGTLPHEWVYWLAYDDQVRVRGIDAIVDDSGGWPLRRGTAYFGPWALRHERADEPYDGPWDEPLESWTSFPAVGPTRLPVLEWIRQQLVQPTYMQMSGSVCPFESFLALRDGRPRKTGPMRIEMAIASAPPTTHVEEFPEPVSIIYGRPNSDRASYGKAARKEDVHLAGWLAQYVRRHPREWTALAGMGAGVAAAYARALVRRTGLPPEEWRVRGTVLP
jgi:hypothetical protein